MRHRLNETRVEIITGVQEAASIPWELLRDPKTDVPLALRARAFVRAYQKAAQRTLLPATGDKLRILLVICRPAGKDDVPFRSIASRLIKGLKEEARQVFQLDVLRPPTFEQLGRVLRKAHQQGQPYHLVHFDGQLCYTAADDQQRLAELLAGLSPLFFTAPKKGKHGYLLALVIVSARRRCGATLLTYDKLLRR